MIIVDQDSKIVNFDNVETIWLANEQHGVEIIANMVSNDQVVIGSTETMERAEEIMKYFAFKISSGARVINWEEVADPKDADKHTFYREDGTKI
jgi:hypothetical protein